ncbi:MAG: hypothetical protein R3355_05375 [Pseudomonas sp.]|nr:hypothetical protein [Pseudomonas sp.]MDX1722531.1 hypothetical protein [Pseudomonas sp.]
MPLQDVVERGATHQHEYQQRHPELQLLQIAMIDLHGDLPIADG